MREEKKKLPCSASKKSPPGFFFFFKQVKNIFIFCNQPDNVDPSLEVSDKLILSENEEMGLDQPTLWKKNTRENMFVYV